MQSALEVESIDRTSHIRKFNPEDIDMLWRECRKGRFILSKNITYASFLEYVTFLINQYSSHWIALDRGVAIGIMFIKTDGWSIEPHADFFNDVTGNAIYRAYTKFFDEIKNMDGTFIIKSDEKTKNLFDRLTRKGYTQYVGEIPNGLPTGSIYMYCKKTKRRKL